MPTPFESFKDTVVTGDADDESSGCREPAGLRQDDNLVFPQVKIGSMPQFTTQQALYVLSQAKEAWKGGTGVWPQLSLQERVEYVQKFLAKLKESRDEIVQVLMWEIGKNFIDAQSEFDRTMEFAYLLIETMKNDKEFSLNWQQIGSTKALVRRAAIGIILCLGPYNYPLNETYATLLPSLLAGNICILKIPTIGGLAHLIAMEAFRVLPPGTIHFISGSGRATLPPLMQTGDVDGLAFIGGSKAADDLIHKHPHPHRLKIFLQLEANNMGIVLPEVFEDSQLLKTTLDQAILGALSFNGQRCTALKLFFCPKDNAEIFAQELSKRVENMSVGLPWQMKQDVYSQITPLPNLERITYLKGLLEDAVTKGAKIVNKNGGQIIGGHESTLMVPAVLYPVNKNMRVYHEEQFGPIVPITVYEEVNETVDFARDGVYGQQVSIFGKDPDTIAHLLDSFSSIYAKVNLNSQCGRSPDTLPFAGRRSSAMGVMSVSEALREFSTPTVVAFKGNSDINDVVVEEISERSAFLKPL